MTSLRSNPRAARIALSLTALLAALLAIFPVVAAAAPPEGEGAAEPQLAFEPGFHDFGLRAVNSGSDQTTMQLRNNGEATTQVFFVDVTGPGAGVFSVGWTDCGGRWLNPGETCSVQVYFSPYDAVPFSAQLRAGSEGGSTFTAELSGEGGRAIFAPDGDPTNFGAVPVGGPGVTRTIEVGNEGNMAGGAFIAVVSGGAVGSFQLLDESCTGILLTPGASCNLQVRFQPLGTGVKSARLSLFGEGDGGTQMTLTGVGLDSTPAPAAVAGGALTSAPKSKHRRTRPRRGRALHRHRRAALAARQALR